MASFSIVSAFRFFGKHVTSDVNGNKEDDLRGIMDDKLNLLLS